MCSLKWFQSQACFRRIFKSCVYSCLYHVRFSGTTFGSSKVSKQLAHSCPLGPIARFESVYSLNKVPRNLSPHTIWNRNGFVSKKYKGFPLSINIKSPYAFSRYESGKNTMTGRGNKGEKIALAFSNTVDFQGGVEGGCLDSYSKSLIKRI